jgi:hypothetical protein
METVASLACSAVLSNWRGIERVAACLRAVGELSGPEIEALSRCVL